MSARIVIVAGFLLSGPMVFWSNAAPLPSDDPSFYIPWKVIKDEEDKDRAEDQKLQSEDSKAAEVRKEDENAKIVHQQAVIEAEKVTETILGNDVGFPQRSQAERDEDIRQALERFNREARERYEQKLRRMKVAEQRAAEIKSAAARKRAMQAKRAANYIEAGRLGAALRIGQSMNDLYSVYGNVETIDEWGRFADKLDLHRQMITIEMEGIWKVLAEADRLQRNGRLSPEQNRFVNDLKKRLLNLDREHKLIFDTQRRFKLIN